MQESLLIMIVDFYRFFLIMWFFAAPRHITHFNNDFLITRKGHFCIISENIIDKNIIKHNIISIRII